MAHPWIHSASDEQMANSQGRGNTSTSIWFLISVGGILWMTDAAERKNSRRCIVPKWQIPKILAFLRVQTSKITVQCIFAFSILHVQNDVLQSQVMFAVWKNVCTVIYLLKTWIPNLNAAILTHVIFKLMKFDGRLSIFKNGVWGGDRHFFPKTLLGQPFPLALAIDTQGEYIAFQPTTKCCT